MKRRNFLRQSTLASSLLFVPNFVKAFEQVAKASLGYKEPLCGCWDCKCEPCECDNDVEDVEPVSEKTDWNLKNEKRGSDKQG